MESGTSPQHAGPSAGEAAVTCGYEQVMRVGKVRLRYFQIRNSLRSRGLMGTLRTIGEKLGVVSPPPKSAPAPVRDDEVLGLQPGEWVEVKSEDEIRETLNRYNMNRNLLFMPEMWKFCGRRFQVLKRMTRLRIESTGEMRQIKNTVLLDGTFCDGEFNEGCDYSCQHLWREVWLRRVDGPETEAASEGD